MLIGSAIFKEDGTLLQSQLPNIVVGDKDSVKLEVSFYENYANLKLLDLSNYVVEAVFERPDAKVSPALLLSIDLVDTTKKYLVFGGWLTEIAGITRITLRLKKDGVIKASGLVLFNIQDGLTPTDVVITEPQFESLENAIQAEENARSEADKVLQQNINKETENRNQQNSAINERINQEIRDRQASDQTLQENIEQHIDDVENQVNAIDKVLNSKLNKVFGDIEILSNNVALTDYLVINSGSKAYRITIEQLQNIVSQKTDYFKGQYSSLEQLQSIHQTGEGGDYAYVETLFEDGTSQFVMYVYDVEDQRWEETKSTQYVGTTTFQAFQNALLNGTFEIGAIKANVELTGLEPKLNSILINGKTYKLPEQKESSSTEVDVTYTNLTPTPQALGGIAKGTTFNKKSIQSVLDMLLYPYVAFSVSCSTSASNGGTFEVGTTQKITSANVNITLGSASISKIELYHGSTLLSTKTSGITSGNNSFSVNVSITSSTSTKYLTAKVYDSTGQTKSANSSSFSFVYPYYYGVISASDTLSESLVKGLTKQVVSKGTKTYSYTMNQQKAVIAYPAEHGNIAKILDENSFNVTETFTKNTLTINGVSYYVYVLNDVNTTTMKYTFSY